MSFLPCSTISQRIHAYAVLAMTALLISVPLHAAQPVHEVIGDWRFTSVLDNVEITSIDDEQAKKLLGRVMAIRKEGTRFGDQTCGAPSLEAQRVEPDLYVRREGRIEVAMNGFFRAQLGHFGTLGLQLRGQEGGGRKQLGRRKQGR